jgi:hypothetical protein
MKYILLFGIIYLVYRFYNKKEEAKQRVEDFPRQRETEELEDFTDYEELE